MDDFQGDLTDMVRVSNSVIRTTAPVCTTSTTTTSMAAVTATTNSSEMADHWQSRSSNTDLCPFPELLLTNMDAATTTTNLPSPFMDLGLQQPYQVLSHRGGFNMFTRVLQINTRDDESVIAPGEGEGGSARVAEMASGFMPNEMMNTNGSNTRDELSHSCTSGPQMPFLPNLANKRRKSQAKKVVCIPAPTGAYSRQSGEVVPSDLWAWRKYGQKPIKDSPYPRGYYKCSSSKGCCARKQVERSRTDPNMLVITYTSEHNHPWPTHRNALAGSTRSCQPSKTSRNNPLFMSNNTNLFVENDVMMNANHGNDTGKGEMPVDQDKHPQQEGSSVELGLVQDHSLNLIFAQQTKALDPFDALLDLVAPPTCDLTTIIQGYDNTPLKRD